MVNNYDSFINIIDTLMLKQKKIDKNPSKIETDNTITTITKEIEELKTTVETIRKEQWQLKDKQNSSPTIQPLLLH